MEAVGGVRRPAVRYYGGKWRIAPWVIGHFPKRHECYVEPFGGAMSVLLRKERSPLEVYNDLDHYVVNFFRMLRERPDELVRMLHFTPWSREEFELSFEATGDALEDARRFYVHCWMGYGSTGEAWRSGWRLQIEAGNLWRSGAETFAEVEHLYEVVERLRGVQIECRPALEVIRRCDRVGTLFYLDPPYVHSARSVWQRAYSYEMTDEEHVQLAEVVLGLDGMTIISGYPTALYAKLYEGKGWARVEREARTNGNRVRVEALWLSPRVQEELEAERWPLFAGVGVWGGNGPDKMVPTCCYQGST